MAFKPIKNVKVTIRDKHPYKVINTTVYHRKGYGTYIKYKGKFRSVSVTRWNNTAYTL